MRPVVSRLRRPTPPGRMSTYHRRMSVLEAVVFDFDGIVLDSETPEYESHRRIYERCGAALTVEEWCDAIGIWTEGHAERRVETPWARPSDAAARAGYPPGPPADLR